jgi:type IV pilus assembly protein PilX
MRSLSSTVQKQTGAALVVGLILLAVLSMMAISSMSTASLDLIMAGNEQYHTRAFTSAEAGIENAWVNGTFDTSADSAVISGSTSTGTYDYQITRTNNGLVENVAPFNSAGKFGAVYFRITSNGYSSRNSKNKAIQELFEVVNSGGDPSCNSSASCDLGG